MHFDEFLRQVTPLLGLQWRAFKRRGVKRKVERRIAQLGIPGFEGYLSRFKKDPTEQVHLSTILTVTISRFFRDKEVFRTLEASVLPALLQSRGKGDLNVWSIGCASGEEPYSLALLWRRNFQTVYPGVHLSMLATDIDERLLGRAKEGRYKKSSVSEVPEDILIEYFKLDRNVYLLDQTIRESVEFRRHNVLVEDPLPGMDLVLCRNLAFTYFSKQGQIDIIKKIASCLKPKGYLVIGKDEGLPLVYPTLFVPIFPDENIFQKFTQSTNP